MPQYLTFDSTTEAMRHFRRCRTLQWFILSQVALDSEVLICSHCKVSLNEKPPEHPDLSPGYVGNRAVYCPQRKRVFVQHYICSWESLLSKILT